MDCPPSPVKTVLYSARLAPLKEISAIFLTICSLLRWFMTECCSLSYVLQFIVHVTEKGVAPKQISHKSEPFAPLCQSRQESVFRSVLVLLYHQPGALTFEKHENVSFQLTPPSSSSFEVLLRAVMSRVCVQERGFKPKPAAT
uniref:Uncharacterized protein n=1 Tax=Nothobranchius furzeri TaxID=105023 RepID=A0A1A8A7H2_NOTFU